MKFPWRRPPKRSLTAAQIAEIREEARLLVVPGFASLDEIRESVRGCVDGADAHPALGRAVDTPNTCTARSPRRSWPGAGARRCSPRSTAGATPRSTGPRCPSSPSRASSPRTPPAGPRHTARTCAAGHDPTTPPSPTSPRCTPRSSSTTGTTNAASPPAAPPTRPSPTSPTSSTTSKSRPTRSSSSSSPSSTPKPEHAGARTVPSRSAKSHDPAAPGNLRAAPDMRTTIRALRLSRRAGGIQGRVCRSSWLPSSGGTSLKDVRVTGGSTMILPLARAEDCYGEDLED